MTAVIYQAKVCTPKTTDDLKEVERVDLEESFKSQNYDDTLNFLVHSKKIEVGFIISIENDGERTFFEIFQFSIDKITIIEPKKVIVDTETEKKDNQGFKSEVKVDENGKFSVLKKLEEYKLFIKKREKEKTN